MLAAVHSSDVTEQQATTLVETVGDTPFTAIVDADNRVVAVLLEHGDNAYESARIIAAFMQETFE